MILAAFPAVITWASSSPQDGRLRSSSHPGRSAPEAQEGWGAAQPRESPPGEIGASFTSETLVWQFTRSPRGALSAVDGPLQRDVTYANLGYGEVVPLTETNSLGHVTTRTVDALGNVNSETDPNDVEILKVFDGLGRVRETWRRGAGAAYGWLMTATYPHDDVSPRWSNTISYAYDGQGLLHVPDDSAETRQAKRPPFDALNAGNRRSTPPRRWRGRRPQLRGGRQRRRVPRVSPIFSDGVLPQRIWGAAQPRESAPRESAPTEPAGRRCRRCGLRRQQGDGGEPGRLGRG